MTLRVAINGFGRIGRLVTRAAMAYKGKIEFVALNDLVPADNLGYLLKYDTMHGRYNGEVKVEGETIIVDGGKIQCCSQRDPATLPWKDMGVDYVIESTGLFTDYEGAAKHLTAGANRVIISAPTKSADKVPTLVMGVNEKSYDPAKHLIVSNASCTTNCL
ncbi:MAG: type I glyceraldehyde-3-phosphate dehydrogenase, partial [Phycisphaeraceae bacterium]|nr:type I glyceraldehyde-3-phosphate dehydrogenase [Phycisphaeraceae bacterium]